MEEGKTKSPLDGFSAESVLKHVYPDTIIHIARDLDKQVDEYRHYSDREAGPVERAEIDVKIRELSGIVRALLEFYVSFSTVGPAEKALCTKYGVDHTY